MRKLAILTFQTLDGVMQAPRVAEEDLSGGFSYGGWGQEYWDNVMEQVGREAMSKPYDLLLGGRTYDIFAPHFSTATSDDPTTQKLNSAKKYVVTSRPEDLTWQNSVKIRGDIASEIFALKKEQGPLIQVHGSWQLVQLLLSKGLVDELRLWTFPVVVGHGKRLFSSGIELQKYKLTKLEPCSCGVFMSIYQSIS